MNKIVASLGLAAVGASSIHAVHAADEMSAPASKFWNVSASLRAFYDDNFRTVADGTGFEKEGSFGISVTPGFDLNWAGQATTARAGYRFSLNWYEKAFAGTFDQDTAGDHTSMTHTFNGLVSHKFSDRYQISLTDSFVVGQEPDQLRNPGEPQTGNQTIPGDNIRNYAAINFDAQLSPLLGMQLGYVNGFTDYDATLQDNGGVPPSPSGAMDRIEHLFHLDGTWRVGPETVALVGYQYGITDYTGDEQISSDAPGVPLVVSDERNSRSQYGYVGVNHRFRPDFYVTFRGGIQFIDFYNDPNDESGTSPYIKASLVYSYNPESRVEVGFSQSRSATDIVAADINGNFVTDSDTSLLYGSINHCLISRRLYGSLIGTFQNNSFNGTLDDSNEQYFQLGLNLQYHINTFLMAEAGYNFDHVSSDIPGREYDRNRVYMGLTASY